MGRNQHWTCRYTYQSDHCWQRNGLFHCVQLLKIVVIDVYTSAYFIVFLSFIVTVEISSCFICTCSYFCAFLSCKLCGCIAGFYDMYITHYSLLVHFSLKQAFHVNLYLHVLHIRFQVHASQCQGKFFT